MGYIKTNYFFVYVLNLCGVVLNNVPKCQTPKRLRNIILLFMKNLLKICFCFVFKIHICYFITAFLWKDIGPNEQRYD